MELSANHFGESDGIIITYQYENVIQKQMTRVAFFG